VAEVHKLFNLLACVFVGLSSTKKCFGNKATH
jgi:hypothetical protein